MIRSQLTFVLVTATGAEVLGEAEGVTDAHGVDVTEVLGAGAVVVLVTVALGEADMLAAGAVVVLVTVVLGEADMLAVDVAVGVAAGSLGVVVTGANAPGDGGSGWWRRPGAMWPGGDVAAEVDDAGATDVLAEVVAQAEARLTALPVGLKLDPECAEISIPPTTPRTASTIPTIIPR